MKYKYGYRVACVATASLLAACGGGDSDSGGSPVQNQRISREVVDYDGNGTPDGTLRYFYDTQGRIVSKQFTYTGDSATDLTSLYGAVSRNETFTYDAAGRITAYSTNSVNGSNAYAYQYAADGTLSRFDIEQKDGSGTSLNKQYVLYTYSGGRLTQTEAHSSTGTLTSRQQLTYGADGFPSLSVARNPTTQAVTVRSDFTWTANGKLLSYRLDANDDGVIDEAGVFTYTGGKLSKGVRTTGGQLVSSPGMTYSYAYDGTGRMDRIEVDSQSNGSVEGRSTIEYETGPCRPVKFYYVLPVVNGTGRDTSPNGDLNYYCAP